MKLNFLFISLLLSSAALADGRGSLFNQVPHNTNEFTVIDASGPFSGGDRPVQMPPQRRWSNEISQYMTVSQQQNGNRQRLDITNYVRNVGNKNQISSVGVLVRSFMGQGQINLLVNRSYLPNQYESIRVPAKKAMIQFDVNSNWVNQIYSVEVETTGNVEISAVLVNSADGELPDSLRGLSCNSQAPQLPWPSQDSGSVVVNPPAPLPVTPYIVKCGAENGGFYWNGVRYYSAVVRHWSDGRQEVLRGEDNWVTIQNYLYLCN